jgi:hypothetical protein
MSTTQSDEPKKQNNDFLQEKDQVEREESDGDRKRRKLEERLQRIQQQQ